jgi:hypothetical protein
MCVATREVKPVEALIRLVASSDGAVGPDLRRRLPGRGVWVTARAAIVREAMRRKAIARSFKRPVAVPERLDAVIANGLRRCALAALAQAYRAGDVAAGLAAAEAALRSGRAIALLHAREAGADEVARLGRLAQAEAADGRPIAVFDQFRGDEFDLAMGRPHVLHAALVAGRASANALNRCRLLADYCEERAADCGRPNDLTEATTTEPAGPTAA